MRRREVIGFGVFILVVVMFSSFVSAGSFCGTGTALCSCGDAINTTTVLNVSHPVAVYICNGTALTIAADNITIDGTNVSLWGNSSGAGFNHTQAFRNITIKNFKGINNFTKGIHLQNTVTLTTIYNNTILVANVTNARGVDLNFPTENHNVSNNNITGLGSNSVGIYLSASSYNEIYGNNIVVSGIGLGGIDMSGGSADNNNVTYNTITNIATRARGIISGDTGNRYLYNNLTVSGEGAQGINIDGGSSNIASFNNFSIYGNGSYGVYITNENSDNNFTSNYVTVSGNSTSYGLYLDSSTGPNYFTSDLYNSSTGNDIFTKSTGDINYLRNVTFNLSDIGFDSVTNSDLVSVSWYLKVNVTNSSGTAVSGVTVDVYNSSGLSVYTGSTDSNGLVSSIVLIDLVRNATLNNIYHTPHTVNVTTANGVTNSTTVNVTSTGSTTVTITADPDTTAPTVIFLNSSKTGSNPVVLSLNVTTNENATCKFDFNDSSYPEMTNSMTANTTGTGHGASVSFIQDSGGVYYFRCSDISKNNMSSGNFTLFNVDVVRVENKSIYDLRKTASVSIEGDWIGPKNLKFGLHDFNRDVFYLASQSDRFGYYNVSSNITENKDALIVLKTFFDQNSISALGFDHENSLIYIGGDGKYFGFYNQTSEIFTNLTFTNSSGSYITNGIDGVEYDDKNNMVYMAGYSPSNVDFQVYNVSANVTYPLFEVGGGRAIWTSSYSSEHDVVFLGGSARVLLYHNISSNITVNISMTDAGDWIGTTGTQASAYSYKYDSFFVGGGPGIFGYYNMSSNITVDLNSSVGAKVKKATITHLATYEDIVYLSFGSSVAMFNFTSNVTISLNGTAPSNTKWTTGNTVNDLIVNNLTGDLLILKNNGVYGLYNITTNVTSDLSTTDQGEWLGQNSIYALQRVDENIVYLAGQNGKFGYYNKTSNITTDLSDRDVGDFIGTILINGLAYDPNERLVYMVGDGQDQSNSLFAVYNISADKIYDLTKTNTTATLLQQYIYSVEYDPVSKAVYLSGDDNSQTYGFLAYYNLSENKTYDLSNTYEHNFSSGYSYPLQYNSVDGLMYVGAYGPGGFGAYNLTANLTYNFSKKGVGLLFNGSTSGRSNLLKFTVNPNTGDIFMGGIDNGGGSGGERIFGLYNITTQVIHDLSFTDANEGNWFNNHGLQEVYGLAFDNVSNGVYIGGEDSLFGFYNLTSNMTVNLTNTDVSDWMGHRSGTTDYIYDLAFDHVNERVYLSMDNGKFGFYGDPNTEAVAPLITSISASASTTSSTITWTTSESANSTVKYGLTQAVTSYVNSSSLVTSHSLSLSGLTTSTTYYYVVQSCDNNNNCNISESNSFTTTAVSTDDSSSSSSGGGGGGGSATVVGTKAKGVSIEKKWVATLMSGSTAEMKVTNKDIPLSLVSFTLANSVNNVQLTVTKLDSAPARKVSSSYGVVHSYIDVATENLKSQDLSEAKFKFSVSKSWLTANGYSSEDIVMLRFNSGQWKDLPTKVLEESGGEVLYESTSPGFSVFAIVAKTVEKETIVGEEVTTEPVVSEDVLDTRKADIETSVEAESSKLGSIFTNTVGFFSSVGKSFVKVITNSANAVAKVLGLLKVDDTCETDCKEFLGDKMSCNPVFSNFVMVTLLLLVLVSVIIYYRVTDELEHHGVRTLFRFVEYLFIVMFAFILIMCGMSIGIFLVQVIAIVLLFVFTKKHDGHLRTKKKLIKKRNKAVEHRKAILADKKKLLAEKQKKFHEVIKKVHLKVKKLEKIEYRDNIKTFMYKSVSVLMTPFNKYDHTLDWIYDVMEKSYLAAEKRKFNEARVFYERALEIYGLLPFNKKLKVYYSLRKLRKLLY
jgi:PGF-pre-PGF domain-containing protein